MEAAPAQSVSKSVTQSTQSVMAPALGMAPLQLDPPNGGVTEGQLVTNPMADGERSPIPLHRRSGPPHALQIDELFLSSAFMMSATALSSPGSGHGFEC